MVTNNVFSVSGVRDVSKSHHDCFVVFEWGGMFAALTLILKILVTKLYMNVLRYQIKLSLILHVTIRVVVVLGNLKNHMENSHQSYDFYNRGALTINLLIIFEFIYVLMVKSHKSFII